MNSLWNSYDIGVEKLITLNNGIAINLKYDGNVLFIDIIGHDSIQEQYKFIIPLIGKVYIKPAFPDRPIVIRSKNKLSILSGQQLEAFVEVPLILTIVYQDKKHNDKLFELPLRTLSRSFFGSSDSGEIAYSLESPLHSRLEDYVFSELSVYCPISIKNKSNSKMNFERMILRVPNLSIYQYSEYLVGSPVHVIYTGQDQGNQTIIRKTPPNINIDALKIYPPREAIDNNLLKKSFYFLKTVYNG